MGDVCDGNSQCNENTCQCPVGSALKENQCVAETNYQKFDLSVTPDTSKTKALSSPGDPCDSIAECTGGSYCRMGYCVCPFGTESVNLQCVPSTANNYNYNYNYNFFNPNFSPPGYSCYQGQKCTGRSYCVNGICTCPAGTQIVGGTCQNNQLPRLMKAVSLLPGEACTPGETCLGGSICSMGICKCPAGFKISAEKCVADGLEVPPGNVCSQNEICTEGSHCTAGLCRCPVGHVIKGSNCEPENPVSERLLPGDQCLPGQTCTADSVCIDGLCKCTSGKILYGRQCIAFFRVQHDSVHLDYGEPHVARPGESCTGRKLCIGGSSCDQTGYCICPNQTFDDNGVCRLICKCGWEFRGLSLNCVTQFEKCEAHLNNSTSRARPQTTKNTIKECPLPENQSACQLPACFCSKSGREIPSGLKRLDTPQLVVLTFDDAVNGKTVPIYKQLFADGKYRNPNGCHVKATFFISHEWTNYDEVQSLYYQGHELAANSITHTSLKHKSLARWVAEMGGVIEMMGKFADVNEKEVIGMRAPQLSSGGDVMFKAMQQLGLQWDNTISANPGYNGLPFWPQTMDYKG